MDVFGGEQEIALAFLGNREGCLKTVLDGCGRDVHTLTSAASGESADNVSKEMRDAGAQWVARVGDARVGAGAQRGGKAKRRSITKAQTWIRKLTSVISPSLKVLLVVILRVQSHGA